MIPVFAFTISCCMLDQLTNLQCFLTFFSLSMFVRVSGQFFGHLHTTGFLLLITRSFTVHISAYTKESEGCTATALHRHHIVK